MDLLSPQVLALGAVACIVITFVVKFMKKDSEDLGINHNQTMSLVEIEDEMDRVEAEHHSAKVEVVKDDRKSAATLMRMNKSQIEHYGRTLDIELDRRMTKVNMIADLELRSE
jgi:hypothetical protein|tara:strand:+ start:2463 stop:2801 length:339 start_codon:yes stop_codon:yes gene_type:complete